jgi:hypothetical protein
MPDVNDDDTVDQLSEVVATLCKSVIDAFQDGRIKRTNEAFARNHDGADKKRWYSPDLVL